MRLRGVIAMWAGLGLVSGLGMALAAWLLIAPEAGPPPAIPFQDKIFHVLAFACLTGPAVLALPARYMWFWAAHMLALGAGIEVVQQRMGAGRTGDLLDFAADAAGVFLALGVGRWLRARFERNEAESGQ